MQIPRNTHGMPSNRGKSVAGKTTLDFRQKSRAAVRDVNPTMPDSRAGDTAQRKGHP